MARVLTAEALREEAADPLAAAPSQALVAASVFCTGRRADRPDESALPEHLARAGLPG